MTKKVIFLHIPKTAGRSFGSIFERLYKPDALFPIYKNKSDLFFELEEKKMSEQSKLKIIYGHFSYGIHRLLKSCEKWDYITFLRDPVDRIISDYYHVCRHQNSPVHEIAVNGSMMDFIEHRIEKQGLTNRMTRMLSGYYGLYEQEPDADLAMYRPLPDNALEMAKKNINKHFGFVGITKNFDVSLLLFQRWQNLRSVHYVKQNVSQNRPKNRRKAIDTNLRKVINDANSLDFQLYNYYHDEFVAKVKALGEPFLRQLRYFRNRNKAYTILMQHKVFAKIYPYLPRVLRRLL